MTKKREDTKMVKDSRDRVLNEGDLKKSFQPLVKPQTTNTVPQVNPKTIPSKK